MPGGLQSGELGRSTGILPVFHGQDGRATRDFAVLLALLRHPIDLFRQEARLLLGLPGGAL